MNKLLCLFFVLIACSAYTQISVVFTQLNYGCAGGECLGEVKAEAFGGVAPYNYNWGAAETDPQNPAIAIELCEGYQDIIVTDANGISFDTVAFVDVYKAPKIDISTEPTEIYYQNPTVQFYFFNADSETIPVKNWLWDFGDDEVSVEESPSHTYSQVGEYNLTLKILYQNDCDTSYVLPITVKTVDLFIPNVFTPNNDGTNDYFIITEDIGDNKPNPKFPLINDFYISNKLLIFNRWGQKVFEADDYQNNWDGGKLADGTYFYVLKCHGEFEDDVFRGSISILGNN